jgi:hypothetical protein
MEPLNKQGLVRQASTRNVYDPSGSNVLWSRHAVAALVDDNLPQREVEEALKQGQVIEDYPATHRPLPDCLVLANLADGRPLHVVIAIDEPNDRIFVVTVHIPTRDRWEDDWRTRRK